MGAGYTPAAGYETERWFVTFDRLEWVVEDYGTGLDGSDFLSDIDWEDVL